MVVHRDTPESERAEALASEGNYAEAARFAAQSAQSRLERFGIESRTNSDLAIGDLLYAIYYARRAGETQTAIHLRETLRSYALMLQLAAYEALQEEWPQMTWACLVGLFEEWIGDAYMFTESDIASRYYDRAEPWYCVEECRLDEYTLNRATVAPCWQWGAEPQYDKTWNAFLDYLDWLEPETTTGRDTDFSFYFFERLNYKRALISRLDD